MLAKDFVGEARRLFETDDFIPLHAPVFVGREKEFLIDCIDSTFVSSVGKFVDRLEAMVCEITGAKYSIAVSNGTTALHIALLAAGVESSNEVIMPALTFVATANAASYCGADPVFLDAERETLGLCPMALRKFLEKHCEVRGGKCINRQTGNVVGACVPVHIFGHPCDIESVVSICDEFSVPVVEDAAESMGSRIGQKHTGTYGQLGTFSFNGNKIVTCGGGGVIVTDDSDLAEWAKHVTTTAKAPHPYKYFHTELGYNYRLPNLNAALACAQLESIENFICNKRELADRYRHFFDGRSVDFVEERSGSSSNYWLNAIILPSEKERDEFLETTNSAGVMTRPIWELMPQLPMYQKAQCYGLENSEWIQKRLVNIPSSVRPKEL